MFQGDQKNRCEVLCLLTHLRGIRLVAHHSSAKKAPYHHTSPLQSVSLLTYHSIACKGNIDVWSKGPLDSSHHSAFVFQRSAAKNIFVRLATYSEGISLVVRSCATTKRHGPSPSFPARRRRVVGSAHPGPHHCAVRH